MKKRRNILILLVLLCGMGVLALGAGTDWFRKNFAGRSNELPDPREELKKLFARYNDPDSALTVRGDILLYDRENKDALKEKTPFRYSRDKHRMAGQLGYLFTYAADSLVVQVDTVNKTITYAPLPAGPGPGMPGVNPLESVFQDTSAIELSVEKSGALLKLTVINQADPRVKSSAVYYTPGTYQVRKAEIEWWKEAMNYGGEEEDSRTWLTVMSYEYLPGTDPGMTVQVSDILQWDKANPVTTPKFRGYQLIRTD